MNTKILGLLVGGLVLASASPALGASVTVEIEGQQMVLAPTVVQTPVSLTRSGSTCATGASALGALDAATGGSWSGTTYGPMSPETILGETHFFGDKQPAWVFMVNGKTVNAAGCGAPVADGDKVLWYWSAGWDPFRASAGYDDPVYLDAPATAVPGQPVSVKVTEATTSFDGGGNGSTAIAPSPGATITAGSVTATTAADGTASLTLPPGPYSIVASKGNRAPARINGCATTGSDGLCGTTATTPEAPPCLTKGDDGFCGTPDKRAAFGHLTGITEGKAYKKGAGPRELGGRVDADASGLKDVQVRLTRNDRGRCATYDGNKEAFVKLTRCGAARGRWFSVGPREQWTYLLPARLGRGRYVVDVRVTDKAGNRDAQLARGRNRVVFAVA